MMSRELTQSFNGESREHEMFDFVLDGEEEDHFNFQQSSSVSGKDDDSVKLFIGQIPKDMDEEALRPYFSEFGSIFELTVIRDKTTRIHRGCAFLTYSHKMSALHAIEHLHDKIKLPNAVNPLQVRPAESQAERENKLFIGMLPKTVTEEDLENTFSQYGELREVHVIRGTDGHSKGCAFIKFMDRESAMVAIDCVHDTTPEGSTRPLVVKFADNKKAVKGKMGLSPPDTPPTGGAVPLVISGMLGHGQTLPAEYWSLQHAQQQQHHHQQQQGSTMQYPYQVSSAQTVVSQAVPMTSTQQQQQQLMSVPYITYPGASGAPSYLYYQSPVSMFPQYSQTQNSFPSSNNPTDTQPTGVRTGSPSSSPFRGPTSGMSTNPSSSPSSSMHSPRSQSMAGGAGTSSLMHGQQTLMSASTAAAQNHANSRPPEGPSGANLFIYHLPRDLTDADLATLFASFGNVISAKVYVDKKTAESKGFGFVSYDSVDSAEEAINTMNGFQIGSKRLKVQHKRSGGSGFDMSSTMVSSSMGGMSSSSTLDRSGQATGMMGGHGMALAATGGGGGGQSMPYAVMSSMGMDYNNSSAYCMQQQQQQQQPIYSDGMKDMPYIPDPLMGGQPPASRQHPQQSVMGLEDQFAQMAVSSSSHHGNGSGFHDSSRRPLSGSSQYQVQQQQHQQRPTQQQMQIQLQQHQQQQHDIRFRGL